MQLHQLKTTTKKEKKRVGRGGKRGTYSGRGLKGQKARAGRKLRPQLRDIIKRIPKKRGYKFNPIGGDVVVVNLKTIEDKFNDGDTITLKKLREKKVIRGSKKKHLKVKILGQGKLTKKFFVVGCDASKTAEEAINKVGGSVKQR